ncbi:D-TA family PLP-dependent enzyme [Brucella gallinifaecis]|uniref:D-TA family PLP-dependent enzyme n=1 Tax=Brucella gallinifaecis TaxID=215590 RepID=A0A502BUG2_9HYPH|nr:D-TA family PLP-dependent enzyme [Brucella gallinifaecis]TPF76836.1 D-TA family PLP-dependent enzyme [Brucella gallinifaecis]
MTFPWPEVGTLIKDLPTPLPIIDEDRLAANIARVQDYISKSDKFFRPHIKTHKILAVARQQVEAGANGINCQKVTEAEVFADAGFDDILITYNILGKAKLARLKALNEKIGALKVTADNATVVAGLAETFDVERPLSVLVECDTGGKRCGVQTPDAAVALAKHIAGQAGLRFSGILTYPAIGGAQAVEHFIVETMEKLQAQGLDCPIRSNGGSPDIYSAHLVPSATEHRAGTYVYNDRSMVRAGQCTADDIAMHILATVVSRPAENRAVLDCGSKALTSDLLGFSDFGVIEGFESARIVSLSEEHAVVDLSDCKGDFPAIGAMVRVMPNHTCVVSNLFEQMVFHRDGVVTRVEDVAARGTVW